VTPVDVEGACAEIKDKLRLLPHVVSVDLRQPTPFDYRVVVIMDERGSWDTWQRVYDEVDWIARVCVETATVTAEVTAATSGVTNRENEVEAVAK